MTEEKDREEFEKVIKKVYGGERIDWKVSNNPLLIFKCLQSLYVGESWQIFLLSRQSMRDEADKFNREAQKFHDEKEEALSLLVKEREEWQGKVMRFSKSIDKKVSKPNQDITTHQTLLWVKSDFDRIFNFPKGEVKR